LNIPCKLKKGLQRVRFTFNPLQLSTGSYKIVFNINDETGMNPYSNGHYGFFDVIKRAAALTSGFVAPLCWAEPELEVFDIESDSLIGDTE